MILKPQTSIFCAGQEAGTEGREIIFGFETPQAIYKWQRGTALPSVDNLVILSIIFRVKIEDILVLSDYDEIKMCG
ncbi:XRE family transcriptional regulator [Lachnospiraceae bacterium OF09-33XD]|nr:XRE family transcriptional regulator [Lachnospiraceae bacterium OF09-33XD]